MANIDTNFASLTKEQAIQKYISNIQRIRVYSQSQGITDEQFNEIIIKYFDGNIYYGRFVQYIRRRSFLIIMLIVLLLVIFHKHETASVVLRNIQVLIYPGMKIWRKLTLPIIKQYPSLTG